jgi:hypothetical protein
VLAVERRHRGDHLVGDAGSGVVIEVDHESPILAFHASLTARSRGGHNPDGERLWLTAFSRPPTAPLTAGA